MQTLQDANDTFLHLLQSFTALMSERPKNAELDDKTALQCDEELGTLRSVSKKLEQRIALVCRRRNTFTSINSLPPELLVDIFAISINTKAERVTSRSDHGTLALVCHYWNHLVDTTPSLWTKIQRDHRTSITRVIRALEKSQNAPLEISCRSWGAGQAKLNAFMNAIIPHAHRWKEVTLWLGEAVGELEAVTTLSMPLLEYLDVSVDEYHHGWSVVDPGWARQQPLDLFGGRPPPRLRRLFLGGFSVLWSPTILCHLTVLSISRIRYLGPSLDQVLAVLSACPGLESLSLIDVSFSDDASTPSSNPVHMLALQTLELRTLTSPSTNRLLASVHAPHCISGALTCDVWGDPLETLFTSDIGHFLDHFRSNTGSSSIICDANQFKINWTGPWIIELVLDNISFAKNALLWLSGPSPIPPLRMTINEIDSSPADILPVVADMESLYRIVLGYEVPVSDVLTQLANCSSEQGSTRWPFPALVEMSIESGIGNDEWEGLLLMLRRRQGASEIQDNTQHPKALRILEFGSNWSAGADNLVIVNFSSTFWPNRLDEVRRLLGSEGVLWWYGRIVTKEGVLEDRVGLVSGDWN